MLYEVITVKYRLWVEAQDDEKKVKGVVGLEWGGLTRNNFV